jgi:hypothetical protein
MMRENFPARVKNLEIPEARIEGVEEVFNLAVGFLNISKTNHASPSETWKDVENRKIHFQEMFGFAIDFLEKTYPCGDWERRAREEVDRRFPGLNR